MNVTDGERMKTALVAYLAQCALEDRNALMVKTRQAPVWIDPDGLLHVGPWLFGQRDGAPVLTYREPPKSTGSKLHVARLESEGAWRVSAIETHKILPR